MKTLLKTEEIGQFVLGLFLFSQLNFSWWWFVGLFFVPDIGMLGYMFNTKIGAVFYNIFHHKGLAIFLFLMGIYIENESLQLSGVILFSHAAFDRVFGYGLKCFTGFKHTHLGEIGK
ncbi:MAG TPA: DUF4260 family protein [Leeuwenhoekiella sp.]|nr:DUF4260 family protein [Leeuwenhoekiella sp.]